MKRILSALMAVLMLVVSCVTFVPELTANAASSPAASTAVNQNGVTVITSDWFDRIYSDDSHGGSAFLSYSWNSTLTKVTEDGISFGRLVAQCEDTPNSQINAGNFLYQFRWDVKDVTGGQYYPLPNTSGKSKLVIRYKMNASAAEYAKGKSMQISAGRRGLSYSPSSTYAWTDIQPNKWSYAVIDLSYDIYGATDIYEIKLQPFGNLWGENYVPKDATFDVEYMGFFANAEAGISYPSHVWTGKYDTSWYGNPNDEVFYISSPEQLAGLSYLVNNTEGLSFAGKTVKLTCDIILNDTASLDSWATAAPANKWEAIGHYPGSRDFMGTLDGDGHTIYGLYTKEPVYTYGVGLFGVSTNLTVKNLKIKDFYINAIRSGSPTAGGVICGYSVKDLTVEDCEIENGYVANSTLAGSIAGNAGNGASSSARNKITVKGTLATNVVLGTTASGSAGGFFGGIQKYTDVSFDQCGAATAAYGQYYAGGFVGTHWGENNANYPVYTVKNCFTKGIVEVTGAQGASSSSSQYARPGIFVGGDPYYTEITAENCYSTAELKYVSGNPHITNYYGASQGIYYLPHINVSADAGAKAVKLTNMLSDEAKNTFKEFDFANVWVAVEGDTPRLKIMKDTLDADRTEVYTFDYNWDELSYTFTPESTVWNPETHEYESQGVGVWTASSDSLITATNTSGVPVNVGFDFAPAKGFEALSGSFFKQDGSPYDENTYLIGGEGRKGARESVSVSLKLDGNVSRFNDGMTVGSVMVKVDAITPEERRMLEDYLDDYIKNGDKTINNIIYKGEGTSLKQTLAPYTGSNYGSLVIYPEFPASKVRRDYMYSVSVLETYTGNKGDLPVYNMAMESDTTRGYDGADSNRRFATFGFNGENGPVQVKIKVNCDVTSYSVMPSAKNFKSSYENGVITVTLDGPEYFLVRINDSDDTILSVFADTPDTQTVINNAKANADKFIEVNGFTETANKSGFLVITEPNTTVYLAPGAILYARIVVRPGATGFRILGAGAILDPFADIYNYNRLKFEKYPMVGIYEKDAVVEGIHVLNAHNFNVMSYADNAQYYDLKILTSRICTDGIGFLVDAKGGYANHIFVYGGDNGIVFENNGYYSDLTLGNTCANLFPQSDVYDTTINGVYCFRADDGVVNNFFAGSEDTEISNVNIKNISTVDVTYTPTFFKVQSMGSGVKDITFTNVSMRAPGKTEATGMANIIGIHDPAVKNYTVNVKNLYVDGTLITPDNKAYYESVAFFYDAGSSNTINLSTDSTANGLRSLKKHIASVSYTAPNKVFIGTQQIFLAGKAEPWDSGDFALPYAEIRKELYTEKTASETFTHYGTDYVKASVLKSSGLISSFTVSGSSVYITPNSGAVSNLLTDEMTGIPTVSSKAPYEAIVTYEKNEGESFYNVINIAQTEGCGAKMIITEELHKFGAGTYRLTLKLKASPEAKLQIKAVYKDAVTSTDKVNFTVNQTHKIKDQLSSVGRDWQSITFDFTVTAAQANSLMTELIITSAGSDVFEVFSMKDVVLTKTA